MSGSYTGGNRETRSDLKFLASSFKDAATSYPTKSLVSFEERPDCAPCHVAVLALARLHAGTQGRPRLPTSVHLSLSATSPLMSLSFLSLDPLACF